MKRQVTMLLVAVALIAVSIVLYAADIDDQKLGIIGRHNHGHEVGSGAPDMMGLFGLFEFADELEITNPQLLQLRILFQKSAKTFKGGEKRDKFFKKLSDANLTEEEVKKIASEEGKALEEGILARFQIMQELKKILTPEQFKKLHEHRPPMRKHGFGPHEKFGKMGHPGFPTPHPEGFNCGFNELDGK